MSYQLTTLSPSPPDPRDYNYVPSLGPFPASIDISSIDPEIEDQGSRGTCFANALHSAITNICKRAGDPFEPSRLFIDYTTRDMENRLTAEGGAIRDALNIGRKLGICDEALWPYDLGRNWNVKPSAEAYAAALQTQIVRYEAVTFNSGMSTDDKINAMKSAINEGLVVYFGLSVGQKLFDVANAPWRQSVYPVPNTTSNPVIGGHGMIAAGYDDAARRFKVKNSWGSGFGDSGYFGMTYEHVDDPFFEAWVVRNFANVGIHEVPGIKLKYANSLGIISYIVPEPSEVGTTTNLWIAAKMLDGSYAIRKGDTWQLYDGTLVSAGRITLTDPVEVVIEQGMSLFPLRGVEVYLAYGDSPLNWKLQKLLTITGG